MRLHVIKKLPETLYVACSGGIDSMVLLHHCLKNHRKVTIAHYHHGNEYADEEFSFVERIAKDWGVQMIVEFDNNKNKINSNKEHYWREQRYKFFHSLNGLVATGHHLNDALEWYWITCLRGEGHFMSYNNQNVIRPFLINSKAKLDEYANQFNIPFIEDPSNSDASFALRNDIRKNLIPEVQRINPGMMTVVRKRILAKVQETNGD